MTLKEQFQKVILQSQYYFNLKELGDVDNFLDKFTQAKQKFINAFGGNYIYECPEPIEFELSEEEKRDRYFRFVNRTYYMCHELYEYLSTFVSPDEFFKNTLSRSYSKDIPKGMKLLKSFRTFIKDKELLEKIQQEASMVIQEGKLSGKLCFSVHPLDFLSISESNYNWRSCHALDGEYRSGNLSYMIDKSTFVCYIKADAEDVILPNFPSSVPWNNKKWRVLLFLSDCNEVLVAGRQYPFAAPEYLPIIFKKLKEETSMLSGDWDSDWKERLINSVEVNEKHYIVKDKYITFNGSIYNKRVLFKRQPQSLNYNDLLESSCYNPLFVYKKDFWGDTTKFNIGGEVTCLNCGKDTVYTTDSMLCKSCELEYGTQNSSNYYTCSICNARSLFEDTVFDSWDSPYCQRCSEERLRTCDRCGQLFPIEGISEDRLCRECYELTQED